VGDPQMEKKCLELIHKLKLDADILTDTELREVTKIKFLQETWTIKVDGGEHGDGLDAGVPLE